MAQCLPSTTPGKVSPATGVTDTRTVGVSAPSCRISCSQSGVGMPKGSLGRIDNGGNCGRLLRNEKARTRREGGKFLALRSTGVALIKQTEDKHNNATGDKFPLQDILEAQQFDRKLLNSIFGVARQMEQVERDSAGAQMLRGYLMATLFYEPSTRTRLSFESAMKRLGGEVLTTENAREFSSAAKGETLEG